MKLHKDSHIDHGLTAKQLAHLMLMFDGRDGFFIETVTLPEDLGGVPCGLFGPVMGDPPIPANVVEMRPRKGRAYDSRMVVTAHDYVNRRRKVNTVTVIAGPHDGHPCVLYTAFGGPIAPKEPGDPTLREDERAASISFWSQHALVEVD